ASSSRAPTTPRSFRARIPEVFTMGTRPVRARGLELPWIGHERQRLPMLNVETSSEAHDAIRALVRRFDPDAIDVPGGSARIRLEARRRAAGVRVRERD